MPDSSRLALGVISFGAFTLATACTPTGLAVGHRAPDFQLADMQGRPVSLNAQRGKVVLLTFWASW